MTPSLPADLVENVARGSSVLFLGADVAYDTADWSGPPARPQLAAALARKYPWVPPGLEWALTAEAFLSREPADHHGLIAFVRELSVYMR